MKLVHLFRYKWIIVWLILLSSCASNENQLNLRETKSFNTENVILYDWYENTSLVKMGELQKSDSLVLERIEMINTDLKLFQESKSINDYVNAVNTYDELVLKNDFQKQLKDSILLNRWFELNLELLKESGDTKYADALQLVVDGEGAVFMKENTLKEAICTRSFDKVFVNLFLNADLSYRHTTGGVVGFEINKKGNNHIEILFNNPDKRYVDLYIRIPNKLKNASVNVGGVKYKTVAGEYCLVSKKWKKGNLAIIDFEY